LDKWKIEKDSAPGIAGKVSAIKLRKNKAKQDIEKNEPVRHGFYFLYQQFQLPGRVNSNS
jgi:hypothetical protein